MSSAAIIQNGVWNRGSSSGGPNSAASARIASGSRGKREYVVIPSYSSVIQSGRT